MHKLKVKIIDCTLRDGGYYNAWDFEPDLVDSYLEAMSVLKVDYVEIGFRTLTNKGFKGGFAFSTDQFLKSLTIPVELIDKIGVMLNASDLIDSDCGIEAMLNMLFTVKSESPVSLVRIACHAHEFKKVMPAVGWLKRMGYRVGVNLMQIADQTDEMISSLAKIASDYPIDVLYFADSMGCLGPSDVARISSLLSKNCQHEMGVHAHDNMNRALANSIQAIDSGASWVDCTVTGMGRGPGNVQTEYLVMALSKYRHQPNLTKLLEVIRVYFKPLQMRYGWGANPYYYLAGEYGIHPSYVQEMIADSRYSEEDILAVIEHLRIEGGKKFSLNTLDAARHFYQGESRGEWSPRNLFENREVLLLGTGPGVKRYRSAIQNFIKRKAPIVLALNTQSAIDQSLIDVRVACHPMRLLADCAEHVKLPQPLITPASMLPSDVIESLSSKSLLDYGLQVQPETFEISETHCILPTSLVVAYALAALTSGKAKRVLLAGFDGYPAGDARNEETTELFEAYFQTGKGIDLTCITPTKYRLPTQSVYGLIEN